MQSFLLWLQSQLGLVPGSTAGRFSGGLLQCVFSHYKHVNASNAEADRVPALGPGDVYYLELGTGPASATGENMRARTHTRAHTHARTYTHVCTNTS